MHICCVLCFAVTLKLLVYFLQDVAEEYYWTTPKDTTNKNNKTALPKRKLSPNPKHV